MGRCRDGKGVQRQAKERKGMKWEGAGMGRGTETRQAKKRNEMGRCRDGKGYRDKTRKEKE